MANDGKIYITISDERISGGSGTGSGGGLKASKQSSTRRMGIDTPDDLSGDTSEFGEYLKHEAMHFLRQETMTAISRYIGTIGERTGNYNAQHNAQVAFGMATKAVGLGLMAKTGAKIAGTAMGGVVGLVVGGSLMVANTALNEMSIERQIRQQNLDISELRKRAGMSSLNDGSRGTEN